MGKETAQNNCINTTQWTICDNHKPSWDMRAPQDVSPASILAPPQIRPAREKQENENRWTHLSL